MSLVEYVPVILTPLALNITGVSNAVTFTLSGITATGGVGIVGHGYGQSAEYISFRNAQVGFSISSGGSSSSGLTSNFGYVGA